MGNTRTYLLMAGLTALFLVVGFLLARAAGALIALAIVTAINLYAWYNSGESVLRRQRAQRVDLRDPAYGWLVADVEAMARRAGLPVPVVAVIPTDQPNAFATGRNPENAVVCATEGLLRRLSREEVAGVMAHELAHVQNRDTLTMTVAASLAGAVGFLSNFAYMFRGGDRPNPILMLVAVIVAPLAAMLVQMAISRAREFAADARGAEICGQPQWLAGALQQIEATARRVPNRLADSHPASAHLYIINPLSAGAMAGLFRTHPPTEERVRRLMALEAGATGGLAAGRGSVPPSG